MFKNNWEDLAEQQQSREQVYLTTGKIYRTKKNSIGGREEGQQRRELVGLGLHMGVGELKQGSDPTWDNHVGKGETFEAVGE